MSNNLFVASDCTHDPAGGLPSISAVPACTYIDSSGQEFIDMETHQMDIDARDAAYRQEVHNQLVRQQSDPAQKAELKAFLAEFYHFDNFGFDVDIYKRPWIIKKRAPNDSRPIRRSFTSCYDFKAIVVRKIERDKITEWIYVSFRIPYKPPGELWLEKDDFSPKKLLKKFMSAGGVLYYTADSKQWADLLAAFISSILDTEHPYLLPPVGWYQSADGRWIYTPQLKEALATPAVDTTRSNRLSLVLAGILGIIKTRIPDKFKGVHRFFAFGDDDAVVPTWITADDIPKHFNEMLDQHGPDVLLPISGDDPMLTATIGNYRSKTNFATLITRTKTEPRFPLCLIVSTNGITELQQKHCLFLPHEEGHAAALPLTEIVSKLCTLVEHNPDAFERIVERSYTTALGSLDEECAFRNEIALLSVSSAVLCWALKLLKQPDSAQTTHEVCQAYINNCLSEWDSSLDCNAKEILHKALFSASEAGDIRLLRYGEVDSTYDPDRDIVQKGGDFLLKGSLLKYLICEYAQGYSASAIISHLQSEHLLSEFSIAKKIRIDNGTYVDARLLTLKRSCLTEYEDSD